MHPFRAPLLVAFSLLPLLPACTPPPAEVTAWRIRTDDRVRLNEDAGWAAPLNTAATVHADQRFRIRFEVQHRDGTALPFRLEVRRNGGASPSGEPGEREGGWIPVEAMDHPYPDGIASPITSIVSTRGYRQGNPTTDLLDGAPGPFTGGAGVAERVSPPARRWPAGSTEWEWALVLRYFSDGAVRLDPGDVFEYRVVAADGTPLAGPPARVTLEVPAFHLGGTYVETPGRIGPWEASNGDLYFVQEPSETYNVFMMVKSTDRGRTWAEVDGANRPPNGDLEAVASVLVDGAIHMIHQADSTWYYRFNTSDHGEAPDHWAVRDEELALDRDPPTQVAALAARSDGSLVAVYGGDVKLHLRVRSPEGNWGEERTLDPAGPDTLSGPVAVTGAGDVVHLAYVDLSGNGWLRQLLPDGSLTPRVLLASGLGTREEERASILPLVWLPGSGTLAVIYRTTDGRLLERRLGPGGTLSTPVLVTGIPVASGPVDSDQATADAIGVGDAVHVLFVEEASGSLWHVSRPEGRAWASPTLVMDGIQGQWVRGALLERGPEGPVYGFVVDTGSDGGSGFNRYGEVPLR